MNKDPDAIFLEISWNRLISVVDEAAAALVRTAFSPIIREAHDYACVLFDEHGRSLVQSTTSVPAFIGTMPNTMRHLLSVIAPEDWIPGDVIITNDPWIGSGHLQDISMVTPIYNATGDLIAFSGVVAHPADMGGRWSANARSIYEEGLQIPICKLMKGGKPNDDIFAIIRQNVRIADQVIGDLYAMMASCETSGKRLTAFMSDVGLSHLGELAIRINQRSEEAMRREIRKIPDGVYGHSFEIDGSDHPLRIEAELRVDGSDITIDYAGSSKQVATALNCPWVYTNAYTVYALKAAINPTVPNNEGALSPFHITAPEGSLLNPSYPAAVGARNLTGHLLPAAVFGALVKALPQDALSNKVLAESASPRPLLAFNGHNDEGERFSGIVFVMGGMGARPDKDGIPCVAFPSTTRTTSVEILENTVPVRVERAGIRSDSGGPGRYRGGEGQEFVVRIRNANGVKLSLFCDRKRFPPRGLLGGGPGSGTSVLVNDQDVPIKGIVYAENGDIVKVLSPGGGGFGAREDRDLSDIRRDLKAELISAQAARKNYPQFDRSKPVTGPD